MSEQTDKPMSPESRRYTAEELRAMIAEGPDSVTPDVLRQAAEDCAVLERLEAHFSNGLLWSEGVIEFIRSEVRHGR